MITTNDFAKTAVDYAESVNQKVILINGTWLAELMIEKGSLIRAYVNWAK